MKCPNCKTEMEFLGGGKNWCPQCGTHLQKYVCVKPVVKTPKNFKK